MIDPRRAAEHLPRTQSQLREVEGEARLRARDSRQTPRGIVRGGPSRCPGSLLHARALGFSPPTPRLRRRTSDHPSPRPLDTALPDPQARVESRPRCLEPSPGRACQYGSCVRSSRVTFAELGLISPILQAVEEAGYSQPTPIQARTIPPALDGRDILGCAQTGTGKTAAFALPILQRVDAIAGDNPKIRALVVTPTRELAAQIGENFKQYGKQLDLWHTVIFGGVSEKPQIQELKRGVDVLVATPGRLLDLMGQGFISLADIELFVLDEADQMLDMGFLPAVRRIVRALPETRQTLFFSATMPPAIMELADGMLKDPTKVAVARVAKPAELVDQQLMFVDKSNKRHLLIEILQRPEIQRALVFSRTKHGANRIVKYLDQANIRSAAIHGNKSQGARTRALDGFKAGSIPVLVATDIAARGIDVDAVSHVINFDLPNVPETYVHRIGRTARAGASGVAYSFCDDEEREYLVDIERLVQRHIPRIEDHAYPPTAAPPEATQLGGRRQSSGGSGKSSGGGDRGASRASSGRPRRGGRRPSGRGRNSGGGGRGSSRNTQAAS